jgi:hypothetical protein
MSDLFVPAGQGRRSKPKPADPVEPDEAPDEAPDDIDTAAGDELDVEVLKNGPWSNVQLCEVLQNVLKNSKAVNTFPATCKQIDALKASDNFRHEEEGVRRLKIALLYQAKRELILQMIGDAMAARDAGNEEAAQSIEAQALLVDRAARSLYRSQQYRYIKLPSWEEEHAHA